MKLNSSHKVVLITAAVLAGGYFGWQAYAANQVDSLVFQQVSPGKVSLVGIDTGRGYKILVSNQVAQLVQLSGVDEFDGGSQGEDPEAEAMNKRRVPLREMLEALQGDTEALGKLVIALNDPLRTAAAELPPNEVLWDAAELKRALEGDASLVQKLERDLNMKLDGTPLNEIRPAAVANGIVIRSYVPVKVKVKGVVETLLGPIKTTYRPRFTTEVYKTYQEEFNPTSQMIQGRYLEQLQKLNDRPGDRENIADTIRNRIDEKTMAEQYADAPSRILASASIVVSDEHLAGARVEMVDGPRGEKVSDMKIRLTDEGRKRLWQYSRRNPGRQLLFIQDGIAIAAPRIRNEIAESEVTIRQIQDTTLARETAQVINDIAETKRS